MFKIAPSILAADFARLGECIREVEEAGADLIHVDVMDGHFVPNITVGIPVVESLRRFTRLPIDTHLMIENAYQFIPDFVQAGANMISVHLEADRHLHRTLQTVREHGLLAGVAVNPATPISMLEPVLGEADFFLIMSVNPGFGGQRFISSSLDRIRTLRMRIGEERLNASIEVDGGIETSNYQDVVHAGADILVAGSAIFRSGDAGSAVRAWNRFKYADAAV